jgi:hypothetical protein
MNIREYTTLYKIRSYSYSTNTNTNSCIRIRTCEYSTNIGHNYLIRIRRTFVRTRIRIYSTNKLPGLRPNSGLVAFLNENTLIDRVQHYIFGDSGYSLRPYLVTRFEGAKLKTNEQLFNKRIPKARVSIEWAFKDIKNISRTLRFPKRWFFREHQAVRGTWQAVYSGI